MKKMTSKFVFILVLVSILLLQSCTYFLISSRDKIMVTEPQNRYLDSTRGNKEMKVYKNVEGQHFILPLRNRNYKFYNIGDSTYYTSVAKNKWSEFAALKLLFTFPLGWIAGVHRGFNGMVFTPLAPHNSVSNELLDSNVKKIISKPKRKITYLNDNEIGLFFDRSVFSTELSFYNFNNLYYNQSEELKQNQNSLYIGFYFGLRFNLGKGFEVRGSYDVGRLDDNTSGWGGAWQNFKSNYTAFELMYSPFYTKNEILSYLYIIAGATRVVSEFEDRSLNFKESSTSYATNIGLALRFTWIQPEIIYHHFFKSGIERQSSFVTFRINTYLSF